MPRLPLCLLFVLLLSGCFRALDAVRGEPGELPRIGLTVRDHSGAVWDAQRCPRWPRLTLEFAQDVPDDAARHLFLLRAAPSDDLLAKLASSKLSESVEAQLLPLTIEAHAKRLHAHTTSALEPAGAYTLVWAEREGAVQLPLTVSPSPAAGAQLAQSLPAAQDGRVPPNLASALLQFDGYVRGDVAAHVQLLDALGSPLPARTRLEPCAAAGLGPGDCIHVDPEVELSASGRYRIVLSEGLSDATLAALPALEIAFESAAQRDLEAPRFLPLDCALDEARHGPLCVLTNDAQLSVRARSDENGLLELALPPTLHAAIASAGEYALLAPLLAPARVLVVLRDMAGNRTGLELEVAPVADLAKVSIEEVRADPLGPEPSQEYVELLNFGDTPVSIEGFTLTDDPYREGERITDERALFPGERVLLVAPDFDAQDQTDGAPASGASVVRLSGALSLRNDGAALLLRDARGRRVSASPGLAAEGAGLCIRRLEQGDDAGRRSALGFVSGSCTPGRGSDGG